MNQTQKQFAAYFAFIAECRLREAEAKKGYTENHHIVPESWGGTNARDNLVDLSYRDHIYAHYLLAELATDKKERQQMVRAVVNMLGHTEKGELPEWNEEEAQRVAVMRAAYRAASSSQRRNYLSDNPAANPMTKPESRLAVSVALRGSPVIGSQQHQQRTHKFDKVSICGQTHSCFRAALEAVGLSLVGHKILRQKLKQTDSLTIAQGGRDYKFEIVAPE